MEFWYLFIFRAASGIQNGLGYANYKLTRTIVSVVLIIILVVTAIQFLLIGGVDWLSVVAFIGVVISIVGIWGVEDSFDPDYRWFPTDIHLWELLATGGISVAWVAMGGNIYLIIASVYPSLLLHKAAINIIPRLAKMPWREAIRYFFDHQTDDATGKTFRIPLLNISIPRLSLRGRKILAGISLVAAVVIAFTHWRLDIYSIMKMLGL